MVSTSLQGGKFSLSNRSWVYRGEGNANIVISLPEVKKVLRLRKSSCGEHNGDDTLLEQQYLELNYIDLVMRAILGDAFVNVPVLVHLCEEDIYMLNSSLSSIRPEHRREKYLASPWAQLFDDLTLIPSVYSNDRSSLCIEIKPKQGIFPPSTLRAGKCLFCLKQQLKLEDGLISKRSQYCPLDLFSGYQPRMIRAIQSLLISPQNNLKVFLDGKLIYGHGDALDKLVMFLSDWLEQLQGLDVQERFSQLLVQALSTPFTYQCDSTSRSIDMAFAYDGSPSNKNELEGDSGKSDFTVVLDPKGSCDWACSALPEGCVLQRLALGQAIDVCGLDYVNKIFPAYAEVRKYDLGNKKSSCDNLKYVHQVIEKKCTSKLDPVEAYLIAATARDSSILITFQKVEGETVVGTGANLFQVVQEGQSKQKFMFKISIVDIDPKPFCCITKQVLKRSACYEANNRKS